MMRTVTRTTRPLAELVPEQGPRPAYPLPLSKLRGLTLPVRAALRRRGIATCERLLRVAGDAGDRDRLAREAGIDPGALLALVRRADLARVGGIGVVFGLMLEELGVRDVAALAAQDPAWLHARLRRYNERGAARPALADARGGRGLGRPGPRRARAGQLLGPGARARCLPAVPAPRPSLATRRRGRGPVLEFQDQHDAGVAQRVDGALPPQLEVAPEPLAVVVGLDRLEPVVEDVDPDQHAPASRVPPLTGARRARVPRANSG